MIRTVAMFGVALLLTSTVAAAEPPESSSPAATYFKDLELVDQDGRKVRLYEDLMADHTVVINSIFTSCAGSCPVMSGNFAALQSRFGDRLDKDFRIISISVDPDDTPAKLKAFAKKFDARPGWVFLTGERAVVERVLRKLGHFVEDKNDHSNVMLIGNDRTGLWKKAFGLARPQDLIAVVQSVLDDRQ
jgi:protein SCO1/2